MHRQQMKQLTTAGSVVTTLCEVQDKDGIAAAQNGTLQLDGEEGCN